MKRHRRFHTILILTIFACGWVLAEDIHQAAKTGDLEQLKIILEKDPSLVNSTDKDKMTPLHHAIDEGKLKQLPNSLF